MTPPAASAAEARACIICATPRSGSTLLCDLLRGSGVAGRPASWFRRQSIPGISRRLWVPAPTGEGFDRACLDAVLRAAEDGTGMIGLRVMQESFGPLVARLGALFPGLPDEGARLEAAFGSMRFVHLSRTDKVAQAVSRARAIRTGLRHVGADGTERERTAAPRKPRYDRAEIAAHVAELTGQDDTWRAWFAARKIEPIGLTCESLSADPAAALAKVLEGPGRDPARAEGAVPETARMADPLSDAWAARFRAETDLPAA